MALYKKPHVGHENHLCEMIEKGDTYDEYFGSNQTFKIRLPTMWARSRKR